MRTQHPTNPLVGRPRQLRLAPGAEDRVHPTPSPKAYCCALGGATAISLARRGDGTTSHHEPIDRPRQQAAQRNLEWYLWHPHRDAGAVGFVQIHRSGAECDRVGKPHIVDDVLLSKGVLAHDAAGFAHANPLGDAGKHRVLEARHTLAQESYDRLHLLTSGHGGTCEIIAIQRIDARNPAHEADRIGSAWRTAKGQALPE